MVRLFIAVDLPAAIREGVAALCAGVEGARWANPQQLHVTLRFLGATPEDRVPAIEEALARVQAPGFTLAVRGVGVFPARARRPRVLWLRLAPAEPLAALERAIDRSLTEVAAMAPEAKAEFRPHLTLARFTKAPDASLDEFLARHAHHESATWPVTEFHLYESTLRQSGAVHERLATYSLGGTGEAR